MVKVTVVTDKATGKLYSTNTEIPVCRKGACERDMAQSSPLQNLTQYCCKSQQTKAICSRNPQHILTNTLHGGIF